ncbi:MAG: hypothetical protein H6553_07375 [Chitinophagales bacterium]|nr:hypothetical protein [Chitinophagales bacterium]
MKIRQVHYFSGIVITLFIVLHLFNHAFSTVGIDDSITLMKQLRLFYRNFIIESILLMTIVIQIYTGIKLFKRNRKTAVSFFDKLQIYTGLYLAIFFMIHLSAILSGRYIMHLDTNFYFGAAGLNIFPLYLFFIPYYALAILSFFGHIASIHSKKMTKNILGVHPINQSKLIIVIGIILTLLIFYGQTNKFKGVDIPSEYNYLNME